MQKGFIILHAVVFLLSFTDLSAQNPVVQDTLFEIPSTGWADAAVTIGYISAPATAGLMFVSALVNEWNAGIAGIPATALILAAPPLIYLGGRSVNIPLDINQGRARLGWTIYALSVIPASLALYGFTTDWGANLPLTISSGILGTASIVVMTTYAFGRAKSARNTNPANESLNFGFAPLPGGAMLSLNYRF